MVVVHIKTVATECYKRSALYHVMCLCFFFICKVDSEIDCCPPNCSFSFSTDDLTDLKKVLVNISITGISMILFVGNYFVMK